MKQATSILPAAVLQEKLKGTQCSEPVKSREPSKVFLMKTGDILVI